MASSKRSSLTSFCQDVLPLLYRRTDGPRLRRLVKTLVATERWVSFDRFHETTAALVSAYEEAGAGIEVVPIATGERIGSGRWIVPEATDVIDATVDLTSPVRRRLLSYRREPFHVNQFTAATPRHGIDAELVVLDSAAELAALAPGALAGKAVLTRLSVRRHIEAFGNGSAALVLNDTPVRGCPTAIAWHKLGFGGLALEHYARRPVCLAVSAARGQELRRLLRRHGRLELHAAVDVRHYRGAHDVVCGLVPGSGPPEEEVWSSAHSMEPGALDNASGVAASVEIAAVLEGLIAEGCLPRPRRTIRLLSGYECFGPFAYFERVIGEKSVFAGVILDALGARPEVCGRRLGWHATLPMSPSFADRVGEAMLRAALRLDNPGYRLTPRPFAPTPENLMGDPQYGFPCPWLTTCYRPGQKLYQGYHSSADTVRLLSNRGLAVNAAAMAGYLYYAANAGPAEMIDMAAHETRLARRQLARPDLGRERAETIREGHARSLAWLRRFADRQAADQLQALEQTVAEACQRAVAGKPRRRWSRAGAAGKTPRRIAPLTPLGDNLPSVLAAELGRLRLPPWTLFWADGKRTLAQIARAAALDTGKPVTVAAVERFFEVHARCGYVEWSPAS